MFVCVCGLVYVVAFVVCASVCVRAGIREFVQGCVCERE